MEEVYEDEKKPFEADSFNDGDNEPDPDETLMLDQGGGRVWLVKIPKDLLEKWSSINAEDLHLATMRVYQNAESPSGRRPRMILFLPPSRDPNTNALPPQDGSKPIFAENSYATEEGEPTMYELEMTNDTVENQIVVAERPKDSSFTLGASGSQQATNSRARTTILTGRIKHDCTLRASFTKTYRQRVKDKSKKYNTPKRQIKMIESANVPGGRTGVIRLTTGITGPTSFSELVKTKQKGGKGSERFARIPRNQLLDLIFQHFRDTPRWTIKALREKTQQPEQYLREVLGEVAFLNKTGEFNGLWELKENFRESGIKGDQFPASSISFQEDVKMETIDDDDDDDDDDEDMEEVS